MENLMWTYQEQGRGVSHHGLAIYIKKKVFLGQKKNYRNLIISPCKNIIFKKKKKSSKRNQNPSRYHNSIITNLKFPNKPK